MQVNGTEVVIALVSLLLTAVIAPLIRAAFVWLKSKTHNETVAGALDEAQVVADGVIAGLEARVVTEMREQSADGTLSAEDVRTVGRMATEQLIRDLSEKSLMVIQQNSDDMSAFISNLIEVRLMKMKKKGGCQYGE